MTYELAKKLKDAGFPFEEVCSHCGRDESYGLSVLDNLEEPTLSELIDACGDENIILIKGKAIKQAIGTNSGYVCFGNSLEEAVANLWLELNENKK